MSGVFRSRKDTILFVHNVMSYEVSPPIAQINMVGIMSVAP